jgi:hypothetical protein
VGGEGRIILVTSGKRVWEKALILDLRRAKLSGLSHPSGLILGPTEVGPFPFSALLPSAYSGMTDHSRRFPKVGVLNADLVDL